LARPVQCSSAKRFSFYAQNGVSSAFARKTHLFLRAFMTICNVFISTKTQGVSWHIELRSPTAV
jgi:hypothetical protein